jgi:recombination protein RecT
MAQKTVLKLLLSKYAPLSADMQKAIETDQSVIIDDQVEYPDNDEAEIINQDIEEKMQDMSLPANEDADGK